MYYNKNSQNLKQSVHFIDAFIKTCSYFNFFLNWSINPELKLSQVDKQPICFFLIMQNSQSLKGGTLKDLILTILVLYQQNFQ